MDERAKNLGVCFFSDRLFYAVNDPEKDKHLFRIGSFCFNFNVLDAISDTESEHFQHIRSTFEKLQEEYEVSSVRALTLPSNECWTALPKIVYDNADEREDHMSIIMKGVSREDMEPTWHSISRPEYKFLSIRRRSVMNGLSELTRSTPTTDFLSDFEIGLKWMEYNNPGGSFLVIGCHKHVISVSSFMLGKFRAATFIKFDQPEDLPYHWLQNSAHSTWMKGLHEHTYLFGQNTHEVKQALQAFWDKSSEVITLNSLKKMGVNAEEETYGFDLASAFPAILLSLDF